MRLLFVALRLPHPVRSGNALILRNYLRYLGDRHEVDLVAFGDPRQGVPPELERLCARVAVVEREGSWVRRTAPLHALLASQPFRVSAYRSSRMRTAVEALVREREYDAVVVQLYEAAQFRPGHFGGAAILDFEDPPSVKLARMAPWLGAWRRTVSTMGGRTLAAYEHKCAQQFDRLVFISRRDADEFGERHACPDRVRWVPHGVEVSPDPAPPPRAVGRIVVTGNMDHPPNAVAACFVARKVFPRVRAAVSDATLWIVGANPTPEVQQLAADPAVTVTGAVPDIRTYLQQAMVAVCGVPVVVGTQTKVLEALACGTPVVTTAAGNHGIEAVSGEQLYVSDEPDEMADRIISLLKGERWTAMSESGKRLVADRFTWHHTGAALERIILDAIAERQPRHEAAGSAAASTL